MKKTIKFLAPALIMVAILFTATITQAAPNVTASKAKAVILLDVSSHQIAVYDVQPNVPVLSDQKNVNLNLAVDNFISAGSKVNMVQPNPLNVQIGVAVQTDVEKPNVIQNDASPQIGNVLNNNSNLRVDQLVLKDDDSLGDVNLAEQTAVIQSDTQPQFGNATLNLNSSGKEKAEVNNDSGTRIVSTYIDTATLSVNTNMKATSAEKDSGQYSNLNEVVGQSQKAIVQLK